MATRGVSASTASRARIPVWATAAGALPGAAGVAAPVAAPGAAGVAAVGAVAVCGRQRRLEAGFREEAIRQHRPADQHKDRQHGGKDQVADFLGHLGLLLVGTGVAGSAC